ncbi:hypothetical protein ADK52_24860 [Streptomyces sp. WM6372]|nr:hypothetical protein ADK52_24860 [Streptomyces sp. WM6372]
MMALTVGEGDADGEADSEADAEGEGEASAGLLSVDGELSGVEPAADADGTLEAEPAGSVFWGPQAVAASATAVATPSVRIMTLWRSIAVPRFLRRVCR